MGLLLLILLICLFILALPTWPYSRKCALIVIIIMIIKRQLELKNNNIRLVCR